MSDRTRRLTAVVVVACIAGFAGIVVLSSGSGEGGGSVPNDVDGAFITGMVAHHQSALEMAVIAVDNAERTEVKALAENILTEQAKEIEELNAAHRRIYGEPVPANGMQHGDLGMSADEMGMPRDLDALADARPFDRAFLDMMVRHHRGAVRMAQAELDRGGDPELRRLARRIIDAQTREIGQMQAWRSSWYGAE